MLPKYMEMQNHALGIFQDIPGKKGSNSGINDVCGVHGWNRDYERMRLLVNLYEKLL